MATVDEVKADLRAAYESQDMARVERMLVELGMQEDPNVVEGWVMGIVPTLTPQARAFWMAPCPCGLPSLHQPIEH